MFLWFSMLFNPTFLPIGALGPTSGLSVHTSVIQTVFATLVGTSVPAFTAPLSPVTGLWMIAVSRYSVGIWGAKLCGLLNIVVNIGFATIPSIVGGRLISAVSGGNVSLVPGIVLIVAAAFVISFFGFAVIHYYERHAWIFAFVLFCVLWGQSSIYSRRLLTRVSSLVSITAELVSPTLRSFSASVAPGARLREVIMCTTQPILTNGWYSV